MVIEMRRISDMDRRWCNFVGGVLLMEEAISFDCGWVIAPLIESFRGMFLSALPFFLFISSTTNTKERKGYLIQKMQLHLTLCDFIYLEFISSEICKSFLPSGCNLLPLHSFPLPYI